MDESEKPLNFIP